MESPCVSAGVRFDNTGHHSEPEATGLRDCDRKVTDLIHVDDFDIAEIGTQARSAPRSRAHVA